MTLSRREVLRLGAGAIVSALLPACSTGSENERVVEMVGITFEPDLLTVQAGTRVRWINRSDLQHTITAYDQQIPDEAAYFASGGASSEVAAREDISNGLVGPEENYEVTLEVPGSYEYFCIPHEAQGMTGTIVVEGR